MKGKRGRPRKKPVEAFVEPVKAHPKKAEEPVVLAKAVMYCECGKESLPGAHQCWDCSHRS